jgi:hypothetical protein
MSAWLLKGNAQTISQWGELPLVFGHAVRLWRVFPRHAPWAFLRRRYRLLKGAYVSVGRGRLRPVEYVDIVAIWAGLKTWDELP